MKEMKQFHLRDYSRHFYAVSAILLSVVFQALWPAAVLSTAYVLELFVGMAARKNTKVAPEVEKPQRVEPLTIPPENRRTSLSFDLTVIDLLEPEYDFEDRDSVESSVPALLLEGKNEQPEVNQDSIKTREGNANELLQSIQATRVGTATEPENTPNKAESEEISAEDWGEAIQLFRLNRFNLYDGGRVGGEHEKTLVEPMSLILETEGD